MALNQVEIKILDARIGAQFPLPAFQTAGAAAIDLIACIDERMVLHTKSDAILISSGISVHVGDPNYCAIILPRSGSGHKKGLILGNTAGLIDSDYQGPLMISAWNRHETSPIFIEPGERIAQLIFVPIQRPELKIVSEFGEATQRGEGGFGSTGAN